jgi:hypothetical protein
MCPDSKESRISVGGGEVPQYCDSIESYIAYFQTHIPKVESFVLIKIKLQQEMTLVLTKNE